MQFSLTNTGITILFVKGFTHGRGYSLLTEESIVCLADNSYEMSRLVFSEK